MVTKVFSLLLQGEEEEKPVAVQFWIAADPVTTVEERGAVDILIRQSKDYLFKVAISDCCVSRIPPSKRLRKIMFGWMTLIYHPDLTALREPSRNPVVSLTSTRRFASSRVRSTSTQWMRMELLRILHNMSMQLDHVGIPSKHPWCQRTQGSQPRCGRFFFLKS